MTTEGLYEYKALKTFFRLLRLSPSGHDDAAIQFSLFDVDLPQRYEALSYTWGEPVKTSDRHSEQVKYLVYCDQQKILIQKNLHDALRELRLKHNERILWVDAIW
jgi:hypothetical protein